MLLLSDGGHVENLAILPLLKRRLPRIVVVDGGYKDEEKFYGESILNAMDLARTKLKCSFLSADGHDVTSDLLEKFVKPQAGKYPRYYKFKVRYQREESGEDSEGEILLITPRDSQHDESKAIVEIAGVDLHPLEEPDGLFHDRVSNTSKLTLCCCECCHRESCHGFSKIFCNAFPQHITANQFFTPQMFLAYHSEGYRACVEANADGFLKHIATERRQWETCV